MLEIKEINILEIENIEKLYNNVFSNEPWNDDWSDRNQLRMYIEDLVDNKNSLAYGLYKDSIMVGLSMGHIKHWYAGTEYYIEELCISTKEQGMGLGTLFLKEIQEDLIDKDIKQIFLQTDKDMSAYKFYKKLGFYELENHVSFIKKLE